jgi:hypothetical protein
MTKKRVHCIFNITQINSEFLKGARIRIFYMNKCRFITETKDLKDYSTKNIYISFYSESVKYILRFNWKNLPVSHKIQNLIKGGRMNKVMSGRQKCGASPREIFLSI